ncbi:MAG: AIR carboxylase family protein [Gammaproteobacteria bacterium]|nr:AIR carboxylase family protein [Gammaproteobacteria bacterium]MBU1703936.1 AIR carboxylase family protein [Nanoarchaeota archaeon]
MDKVLVIFGSESDKDIYGKIIDSLKAKNIDCELKIASAHRNPEDIPKILTKKYSLVIAGAGLAAALPGVVAAHTIRPVIGVPVGANYAGLDALLSIMQMPPGVPVLTVGVNKSDIAAKAAAKMLKLYPTVRLVGDVKDPIAATAISKCKKILDKFAASYTVDLAADKGSVNIMFTYFDEPLEKADELVIYVPLLPEKEKDKAEAALDLVSHSGHGLWVGLGRGDNAAVAAVQIMNIDGRYDKDLLKYKQEIKKK